MCKFGHNALFWIVFIAALKVKQRVPGRIITQPDQSREKTAKHDEVKDDQVQGPRSKQEHHDSQQQKLQRRQKGVHVCSRGAARLIYSALGSTG